MNHNTEHVDLDISQHENNTMKKTLLLCFIHGFKVSLNVHYRYRLHSSNTNQGDDNTFGNFPEHLRALVSHGLPKVDVKAIVYPKFETRGDLAECVSRFRDWHVFPFSTLEIYADTQYL